MVNTSFGEILSGKNRKNANCMFQGTNMTENEEKRMIALETWLQWVIDNCDDSPEWDFGMYAATEMRALLADKHWEKTV